MRGCRRRQKHQRSEPSIHFLIYANTPLLVGWAKIQYTRDDEPTISYINQDKNIDNEGYYVCIKFPNFLILLTMIEDDTALPESL
jgi:hypothetical protein